MIASPARYSILCALVLGGIALLAGYGARLGLGPALLLLPLAAWPAWLGLAYLATLRRIEARSSLAEGARPWWGPFLGGALWRQVAAVPVALLAAWGLGWRVIGQGWTALAWAGAMAAAVYAMAWLIGTRTGPLRPYAKPRPVLIAAPVLAAGLLTGAWALGTGLALGGEDSLAGRVLAEPRYEGASALMAWAVDATGTWNGARAWAGAWAEREGARALAAAWRAAGAFAEFWLLALVFAGLLLPWRGAGRILRPSAADEPPPVGAGRAAIAGFAGTLLLLVAISLLAQLEGWAMLRQHPVAWAEAPDMAAPLPDGSRPRLEASLGLDGGPARASSGLPTPTDLRRAIEAERLGDLACPEGTIAGLRALDDGLRHVLSRQRAVLEGAAREGFGSMRANVPAYLDWYYSLPAEYARTGHLLLGDAEDYLEDRLREHLDRGEPLAPLSAALAGLSGNARLVADWRRAREDLLDGCAAALIPPDGLALVVTATAPAGLLLAGPSVEALDLRARLGGASLAAGAGSLVGVAVGKLVAKEAFGMAVEALGKLALGKATGWAGGAAAGAGGGALVGSVVPGLGTTVGAAVGGVIGGVGAWIATDYALLALEEAISREAFEAEILLAIDEAEAEVLAALVPRR